MSDHALTTDAAMGAELVIISSGGEELDWYDPIASFAETETHWIVDNTYDVYRIPKNHYPGATAVVRVKEQ